MATAKTNLTTLLDRGAFADAAGKATINTATLLPGELSAKAMVVAKNVSTSDKLLSGVVKLASVVKTPADLASLMIGARYQALGGASGFLGAAVTDVSACPDGVGFYRHFKGGSIYWNPRTGAHEVHGAIRDKWQQLGWERSFLGYPTTDQTTGRDDQQAGRFNQFENGAIYWHPATGAFEVHGEIRRKYLELGAEGSFLGYPVTDESGCPDGIGRFNHFQAGSIYWTPRTSAHEVHGLIRNYWRDNGWERNPALGYPITDELIPNRGIGFTPAPTVRKPVLNLPVDVIRLPDPQPSPTLAVVPALAVAQARVVAQPLMMTRISPALRLVSIQPAASAALATAVRLPPVVVANPVAKHTGQSQDRYEDFESGVVFWRRGAAQAELLAPSAQTAGGQRMAWSGPDVAGLAGPSIRQALSALPGASVLGISFVGTTGYSFDGAGVHNRAHRLQVLLQGMRRVGFIPVPGFATVEIQAEINLDPVDREIVGYLTNWTLSSSPGDFVDGGSLVQQLHARLDPALWKQFIIANVPQDPNDPVAVLSVKTQADGSVAVYFEP